MSRALIERRLVELAGRLKQLRADLGVHDEQLAHFVEEADDARLRSLVSETPLAEREHREAARHAAAMERGRTEVASEIARLEALQDELLDQLQSLTSDPAAS
jgi:chromosome segregation ATPase